MNDNAPEMPDHQPTILETAQIGDRVISQFYAQDIDDQTTPNAYVEYRIVSVVAGKNIFVICSIKCNEVSYKNLQKKLLLGFPILNEIK